MRKLVAAAVASLAMLGGLSCRRPLGAREDAGAVRDTGAPGDLGAPGDAPPTDAPNVDVARESAPTDVARDLAPDTPPDVARDTNSSEHPTGVCPADVAPLDVCGCGCCGPAMGRACYYPSLGESRESVPNPMPPASTCAAAGCSFGVRYLCCPDPGGQATAPPPAICAANTSIEDLSRFSITKRDADGCTTIQIGSNSGRLPNVSTPLGIGNADAWRGPCDGSATPARTIGGLGSVTMRPLQPGDVGNHYDISVALFFDSDTGIAGLERIDADDVVVARFGACSVGTCGCGGACAFDTTYRYGPVGGRVTHVDTVTLAPPATYQHLRQPVTTMPPDISCGPAPPACGGPAIDVGDLMAAFADADVQEAFTRSLGAGTTPFYGTDARPSDGQAFQVTRDGGGGFLIGGPCPAGSPSSSCMAIPGGLSRLMTLLIAFDQQQLYSDDACLSLRQ